MYLVYPWQSNTITSIRPQPVDTLSCCFIFIFSDTWNFWGDGLVYLGEHLRVTRRFVSLGYVGHSVIQVLSGFSYLYRVNPSRSLLLHIAVTFLIDVYCILLGCTRFTFEITHLLPLQRDVLFKHGHFLTGKKNSRLTFTAELFLRAIFKYQIEVFGEHELIFLVVPKIVTTMTLDMEDLKQKDISPCPVWPVSLQVKLKYCYVLRHWFKDVYGIHGK